MFRITEFVEFDAKGRARCPACVAEGKMRGRNLALIPNTEGAYKCHRGCSPEQIREAIGVPKAKQIPAALAAPPAKAATITPQQKRKAHQQLMDGSPAARAWLEARGITPQMMQRYELGLTRSAVAGQMKPAISIPIPADQEGTHYYQKKRVEPWVPKDQQPEEYKPWVQKGIPAKVWFTYLPIEATETWLCEGEWDAMLLGWHVRQADLTVAVASFTCGSSAVPSDSELALLPGTVIIWYDRNDKPLKDGSKPGEKGAIKVAKALGDRGKIAAVPMPEDCQIHGWDVTDALQSGFTLHQFLEAANAALAVTEEPVKSSNPLRAHLQWNDELLDTAPEYTDWLVPDLLTTNELFLLSAGPRTGKSLLAMTLAKAVATGETFLDRPVLQGPVIYVRKEDGDSKTKEREVAQGWARGLPVAWLKKFKLSDLEHLRELAEEIQPRLIVLDTLSRIKDSSVNESSSEMSQLLEPLQEMAEELDCCILLVHHTGKVSVDNADTLDIFDSTRGSSSIRSTCRGSMILAAGERNYRLFAENGWGKHDLNVVLDANTLTWRLLGQWRPTVLGTQSEQVIDYLKTCQIATIDQMHADLGIPKMSLYKTLERLQASDVAGEKVVKEGRKRCYTYRLALFEVTQTLFDYLGQSNSLSKRHNPDGESDRVPIRQKNTFCLKDSGSIIDQIGTTAVTCDSDCDDLIDPEADSLTHLSNIDTKTGSNPDLASVLPIGQLFDKKSDEAEKPSAASVSPIRQLFDNYLTSSTDPSGSINLKIGDTVEVIEGRFSGIRCRVESITEEGIGVRASRWVVTRIYQPNQIRLFVKRFDANDQT